MSFSINYPKKPTAPRPKRRQGTPEADERKRIARYLVSRGWAVYEVNSGTMRTEFGNWFRAYTCYSAETTRREPGNGGLTDLVAFRNVVCLLIETKTKRGKIEDSQDGFVRMCARLGVQQYRIRSLDEAVRIANAYEAVHDIVSADPRIADLLSSIADLVGTPKRRPVQTREPGVSARQALFGDER